VTELALSLGHSMAAIGYSIPARLVLYAARIVSVAASKSPGEGAYAT